MKDPHHTGGVGVEGGEEAREKTRGGVRVDRRRRKGERDIEKEEGREIASEQGRGRWRGREPARKRKGRKVKER